MDGIGGDSAILPLIKLADTLDHILSNAWLRRLPIAITLGHYIFFRSWKDAYLLLLSFGLYYRRELGSWLYFESGLIRLTLQFAFAIGSIIIATHFLIGTSDKRRKSTVQPLLIPARTSHARLNPTANKFSYPYFIVGVPVGVRENVNGILSVDTPDKNLSMWQKWIELLTPYKVKAADYLARGDHENGLRGKLDDFLISKNMQPSDYPHAFFVTSPRFFGYNFNPVSFWYLYSNRKEFTALIAEVNNTFDERRPYFIVNDGRSDPQDESVEDLTDRDIAARKRMASRWAKDFHVSPFNSRNGDYSLKTVDPLTRGMKKYGGLDMTIVLTASRRRPHMVARLFGDGKPIEAASLTLFQKLIFIVKWFIVPFATVPRILCQAFYLYFHQSLPVYSRPEPLTGSMGRKATAEEKALEPIFREYLRWKVKNSIGPRIITYYPSGIADCPVESMSSPAAERDPIRALKTDFKVLSPEFYSRFVAYSNDLTGISSEFGEGKTLWLDNMLISMVLFPSTYPTYHKMEKLEWLFSSTIKLLRYRPIAKYYPLDKDNEKIRRGEPLIDKRERPEQARVLSQMDIFVFDQCTARMKVDYTWACCRLFFAQRFSFGFTGIFWLMNVLWRGSMACLMTYLLVAPASETLAAEST